jgi:Fur family ferric uptake transcriptional regulator
VAADDSADLLRSAGLRPTAQRLAVLDAIAGAPSALTAQELHHQLRASGARTGLTTVYRTLSALADASVLDTFENAGEQSFRLCGASHHHHLVCLHCGSVEEIEGAEVEAWVERTAKRRRFSVSSHRADIYGRCKTCVT